MHLSDNQRGSARKPLSSRLLDSGAAPSEIFISVFARPRQPHLSVPRSPRAAGCPICSRRPAGHAHALHGAGGIRCTQSLSARLCGCQRLGNGRQDVNGQLVNMGLSTSTNSTPESMRVATKARFRESRSSLAMTSRALCLVQASMARASSGRSDFLPLATSTNPPTAPAIYVNSPGIESFRLARHRARTNRAPPECGERLLLRSRPAHASVAVPLVARQSRVAAVRRIW